jgi:hypothetical protein
VLSINTLPEEVLLAIFDFYVDGDAFLKKRAEAWQSLVHVCRRWRILVFGSPRRLNLRLVCGAKTPARDTLDVWPPLPLVIRDSVCRGKDGMDDIVAVLKHGSDRVCRINLCFLDRISPLEKVLVAMRKPFPELTDLVLELLFGKVRALPDSFLGGSSPHLRCLQLYGIPFPGLPKLLLSATHLVDLQLRNIPHSGYISPETMVTALSTLTSLRLLSLNFLSFHPNWAGPRPPTTRILLPVLNTLRFEGVTKYLDNLVAYINAPCLNNLDVAFFDQDVFDAQQFIQFISRTSTLDVLKKAHVSIQVDGVGIKLISQTSGYKELNVKIPCRELDFQLLLLEQVCTLCLPPVSESEDLYIYENPYLQPDWPDDIEDTLWLGVLRPFTAVKSLCLSEEIASRIAPALQELVGGRITEVLPALENIFLEGIQPWKPVQEGIEKFIAARQLSGRPITVSPLSNWESGNET